jgi:hypothetical protein
MAIVALTGLLSAFARTRTTEEIAKDYAYSYLTQSSWVQPEFAKLMRDGKAAYTMTWMDKDKAIVWVYFPYRGYVAPQMVVVDRHMFHWFHYVFPVDWPIRTYGPIGIN